jgi:ATP phosphoribosyltransferase regulatory subunit
VRDYLPEAAARRRAVVSSLLTTFHRWGYDQIITPVFEYDEVLARGRALGRPGAKASVLRFVEPYTGEIVALRPDITPQIARLVATRLRDVPGPFRLAYEGAVLRLPAGTHEKRELFQAGVELIDVPAPAGDREIIALAASALQAVGWSDFTIDIGESSFSRMALDGLPIDERAMAELRLAVGQKDSDSVRSIVRALPISSGRKRLLEALPELYGGIEVVQSARRLVRGEAARALVAVETLLTDLHADGLREHLSVDLGEVRGFEYYTGVRFRGYAAGCGDAILSGGRYDRLMERYGRPAAATGFAIEVDTIASHSESAAGGAVAPLGRDDGGAMSLSVPQGALVVGEGMAAARVAAMRRSQGQRVIRQETAIGGDEALALARRCRLGVVVFVGSRGSAREVSVMYG